MSKQHTLFEVDLFQNRILYVKNAVSCPSELIQFIEDLDENDVIGNWQNWDSYGENNSVNYGKQRYINMDSLKFLNYDLDESKRILYIANSIEMASFMGFNLYFDLIGLNKSDYVFRAPYFIKKWNIGSGMGPHKDIGPDSPDYTMLVYLNDNYIGGEIEFPEFNIKIKPEPGSAVIFPSQETHLVPEIENAERYTINILSHNKHKL